MKKWNYLDHDDVNYILEQIDKYDMGTHEMIEFIEERMVELNKDKLDD